MSTVSNEESPQGMSEADRANTYDAPMCLRSDLKQRILKIARWAVIVLVVAFVGCFCVLCVWPEFGRQLQISEGREVLAVTYEDAKAQHPDLTDWRGYTNSALDDPDGHRVLSEAVYKLSEELAEYELWGKLSDPFLTSTGRDYQRNLLVGIARNGPESSYIELLDSGLLDDNGKLAIEAFSANDVEQLLKATQPFQKLYSRCAGNGFAYPHVQRDRNGNWQPGAATPDIVSLFRIIGTRVSLTRVIVLEALGETEQARLEFNAYLNAVCRFRAASISDLLWIQQVCHMCEGLVEFDAYISLPNYCFEMLAQSAAPQVNAELILELGIASNLEASRRVLEELESVPVVTPALTRYRRSDFGGVDNTENESNDWGSLEQASETHVFAPAPWWFPPFRSESEIERHRLPLVAPGGTAFGLEAELGWYSRVLREGIACAIHGPRNKHPLGTSHDFSMALMFSYMSSLFGSRSYLDKDLASNSWELQILAARAILELREGKTLQQVVNFLEDAIREKPLLEFRVTSTGIVIGLTDEAMMFAATIAETAEDEALQPEADAAFENPIPPSFSPNRSDARYRSLHEIDESDVEDRLFKVIVPLSSKQ